MFSLIVTTQGKRMKDIQRLFKSLDKQIFKGFELIMIDQSDGERVKKLLENVTFSYQYLKIERCSLSKARNIGLSMANSEYLAFPDDDCWYPCNLLKNIQKILSKGTVQCVCCNVYDPDSASFFIKRQAKYNITKINELNAIKYLVSVGIFCKRVPRLYFDEELGTGSKWGAGEESDYILKLLKYGFTIKYYKNILVYHPYVNNVTRKQIDKAYKYGQGYGALIRKSFQRKQFMTIIEYIITLVRAIGGWMFYSLKCDKKNKIYKNRFQGMLNGLIFS